MGRWPREVRIAIGTLFVVLAGAHAIRSAVVRAYVDEDVTVAASAWPEHPKALASGSLLAVAQVAGRGDPVPSETKGNLRRLAATSPLSAEPFLVAGATEVRNGNYGVARRLLVHARERDPRSAAARYLLSDLYLRQNQLAPALQEVAVLRRLAPSISGPLIKALAEFIRLSGATKEVRGVLDSDPELENMLLTELATEPRNAAVILQLARPHRSSDRIPSWHQRLVASLVEAGEYGRAFLLWRRYAPRGDAATDISNFERSSLPSPFTWTFSESSAGSAAPDGNALQIFFTGRQNLTFASKLAMLPSDTYGISLRVSGEPPAEGNVSWSVTCLPEGKQVAQLPVSDAGQVSLRFEIPADCVAQKLELKGFGQVFPETAEFTISDFRVRRLPKQ